MLFPPAMLRAIADGEVSLAFRRWTAPRVKAGGRQRTAVGVIGFESVDTVERADIGFDDARRAGFASLEALLAFVDRRSEGTIYRIGLRLFGPDPRVALRATLPGPEEVQRVVRRLARLDQVSRHGPWTRDVLHAIRDQPGVRALDLAAAFGREKQPFKLDVRKLKELGLTESLPRGYRLSLRGKAVLEALDRAPSPSRPR
jgi:hypothetical protein